VGSGSADKITAASAKISRASILFDKASWVFLHPPPPQVPARAHATTRPRAAARTPDVRGDT
jgi:hypothetical protein